MNSSELLKNFNTEISNYFKCTITHTISRQVCELEGNFNCFLYLKTRTTVKANWGITAKVIKKLQKQNKPWFVVLLSLIPSNGYLLSEKDVDYYIANHWNLNQDGDYKTRTSFEKEKWFNSIEQLVLKIEQSLNSVINFDKLLSEAIHHGKVNGSKTSGESKQHRDLKNLIASNPSLIGLSNIKKSYIEFLYPCSDRVDIAFEFMNQDWAVVEIKLKGLSETIVGLFQAIKYKSLHQALLKIKGNQSKVTGYLVAYDIPSETKKLADILSIKTFKVTK